MQNVLMRRSPYDVSYHGMTLLHILGILLSYLESEVLDYWLLYLIV
jgi:hypothetical protein